MNRRILILCEAIAPPAYSPRVLTLVEYLQQQGWHCEIVTEMDNDQPLDWDICPIHSMPTYRHLVADKLFGAKEKALMRFACREVKVESFDMIFCASYYYFPLQAAAGLAKKYHLPLVVDLRDIAEQWGDVDYYTRTLTGIRWIDAIAKKVYTAGNMRQRNRVLQQATAVTTVSPWHQQTLAKYNNNTHLIYNGYDATVFVPQDKRQDQFLITYLGRLYSTQLRDPRLLFEALRQLLAEDKIDQQDIQVLFHTDPKGMQEIQALGAQYHIQDILSVQGYVPRKDILPIMHASSILLVLTTQSTSNGTHGIMGTKFFENIGVEKPILCVRSDEECLADAIEKTNAGIAATQVEQVKEFVMEKYHEWQENGYTRQAVVNKEQFTRQYEAAQFEQLFIETLKH